MSKFLSIYRVKYIIDLARQIQFDLGFNGQRRFRFCDLNQIYILVRGDTFLLIVTRHGTLRFGKSL